MWLRDRDDLARGQLTVLAVRSAAHFTNKVLILRHHHTGSILGFSGDHASQTIEMHPFGSSLNSRQVSRAMSGRAKSRHLALTSRDKRIILRGLWIATNVAQRTRFFVLLTSADLTLTVSVMGVTVHRCLLTMLVSLACQQREQGTAIGWRRED